MGRDFLLFWEVSGIRAWLTQVVLRKFSGFWKMRWPGLPWSCNCCPVVGLFVILLLNGASFGTDASSGIE